MMARGQANHFRFVAESERSIATRDSPQNAPFDVFTITKTSGKVRYAFAFQYFTAQHKILPMQNYSTIRRSPHKAKMGDGKRVVTGKRVSEGEYPGGRGKI